MEELLDDRNRIEKELRQNSRELASKNEELVDLRNMKESLVQRKAKLWKECEKEEYSRDVDLMERDAAPRHRCQRQRPVNLQECRSRRL